MIKQIEIYKKIFPIESELIGNKNLQSISDVISKDEEIKLHSSIEGDNISLHEILELAVLALKVIHEGYKIYITTKNISKTKEIINQKTKEEKDRLSSPISENELKEMQDKILKEIENS